MSEDMTYESVRDWHAEAEEANERMLALAARVAELEHQLAQDDSNMVALAVRNAELERENAELRTKLDAVPVDAIVVLGTSMGANNTRACLLALSQLSEYVIVAGLRDMDLSTYVARRMALEPDEVQP